MPYKQCTDVVTDIQLQSLSGLTLKPIFNFDLFTDTQDLHCSLWLQFSNSLIMRQQMLQEMGFSGYNSVSLCINTPLTLLTRFSLHHEISLHNRINIILKSIIQAIIPL